jgi:hypothetical protein
VARVPGSPKGEEKIDTQYLRLDAELFSHFDHVPMRKREHFASEDL